jgi:ribosomal protein S18 acetylase RimI-like enzyme
MTGDAPEFEIRRYRDTDHDAVWSLHNLALDDAGANLGQGSWDADLHDVQTVYLDAGGEFLVGELAQQIVAMGALRRTGPLRAEIKRLRVAPHRQGRGFGRLVLADLEARARELGYRSLHLDTTTRQLAAHALYRSEGYRETGRGREGLSEVIFFEKSLEPTRATGN